MHTISLVVFDHTVTDGRRSRQQFQSEGISTEIVAFVCELEDDDRTTASLAIATAVLQKNYIS